MLDFSLNDELIMLQKTIRELLVKELEPIVEELDEKHEFPLDFFRRLGQLCFLGTAIPEEYGGSGAGILSTFLIIEEIARVCPSLAMDVMVHAGVVSYGSIYLYGTEAHKRNYLPKLLQGEMIGAIGFTEPNAGSDLSSVQTRAEKVDNGYILNGNKIFITNAGAPLPSLVLLLAKNGNNQGKYDMSTFLVEKGLLGYSIGKKFNKCGMRMSQTNELIFDNCLVPRENLFGVEGEGIKNTLRSLDYDRLFCTALSTGIAQGVFDRAFKYSTQRLTFGKAIANNQSIQILLAKIHTNIHAARLMGHYCCWLEALGKRFTTEAAMAKHFASHMAQQAAWDAMAIHGGYGFMKEYRVEMFFRDNMAVELGGGASGVLDLLIARNLFKNEGISVDTF